MVNNQFMGQPQIPIEVEGRTYYGCCEMCKGRLAGDSTSRSATDPLSGNPVDKATAVIGRDNSGRTFYFENEHNFTAYARRGSP
jgi:YHS domain-containing protein